MSPSSIQTITVLSDVVYGEGVVAWSTGRPFKRALAMDVYLPPEESPHPRPGIIMAFGGAFHRGSKEDDSFEAEGGNTSIAEYCARFARLGYVCFSIDYRLVTEDPDPGFTRVIQDASSIPTSRVSVVRRLLGLPPATSEELWRGIEAASDDMATAFRFIRTQAHQWQVDPARLAAGGFSAGARTALNVAFGEHIPVAAVVSLSGFMDPADLSNHLSRRQATPPVLLVHAEHDLDYVASGSPVLASALCGHGVTSEQVMVPGRGHFYRAEAPALHESHGPTTVEGAVRDFLERHV